MYIHLLRLNNNYERQSSSINYGGQGGGLLLQATHKAADTLTHLTNTNRGHVDRQADKKSPPPPFSLSLGLGWAPADVVAILYVYTRPLVVMMIKKCSVLHKYYIIQLAFALAPDSFHGHSAHCLCALLDVGVQGCPLEPINDTCLEALLKAAAPDSWRLWPCTRGFQFDPKFMFRAKNFLECMLCQTCNL